MRNKITAIKQFCFCILLGCFLLTSCKKEEPPTPPGKTYSYLGEAIKSYMFKTDSYWVYENDSTSVLDSVVVTSTTRGFQSPPHTHPGTPSYEEIEYYKINFHSHLTSSDYNDFLFCELITRNGNEMSFFGQPILFSKYSLGFNCYGAEVLEYIDTLNINGNLFFNVEKMKITQQKQIMLVFSHDTYLYFQDSIGLIKKVTDLGNGSFDSWSLKRWHINL